MPSTVIYRGTCDASAAVRMSATLFVSASDEDYILRVYDRTVPGMPSATFDLAAFLEPGNPDEELTSTSSRIWSAHQSSPVSISLARRCGAPRSVAA